MDKENRFSSRGQLGVLRPLIGFVRGASWKPLCAIAVVALLLRLPNLNESLWFDELWSTRLKLRNLVLLSNSVLFDVHPPFYSIFMYVWVKLFGDTELSIRMPPLIFGISSIFMAYALAVKLADKKTAFLTSLLLCLSPVHIWYSQEARSYSGILFLLLLTILSYYKLKDYRPHALWYAVYLGSLFAAVLSHYYMVVYLMLISAICVRDLSGQLNTRVNRRVLILNALILACLIAFVALKSEFSPFVTGQSFMRSLTLFQLWMLFFNWFLCGNSLWNINPYANDLNVVLQKPVMIVVQLCVFALFMRGVMLILREERQIVKPFSVDLILYLFSLPLFMMGLHLIGFENVYIERSVFVSLPFFIMILAKGVTGFQSRPIAVWCIALIIVFNIISLAAFFGKGHTWTVYKHNPDWRAAAGYFDDELRGTNGPVFAFATTPATELTYYDVRSKEFKDPAGVDIQLQTMERKVKELLGNESQPVERISARIARELELRSQERAHARLLIHYADVNDREAVYQTLSRHHVKSFYLIHNRYWSGRFQNLFKVVMEDSRVQFQGTRSFKGLEMLKFSVVS